MTEQPFSPNDPLPIMGLVHDGDNTRKYILRCRNHPHLRYRSEDPRGGSPIIGSVVCECSWVYLDVIGREP
jgi:hypothetical protein